MIFISSPAPVARRNALTGPRRPLLLKRGIAAATALALSACATQQDTGAVLGAVVGAVAGAGAAAATSGDSRRIVQGAVAGALVGGFAGSAIGARLDAADRQRAEAAAQRAIAERDAAVQRAVAARNAEIERQLREELAQSRSATERANAELRAARQRESATARAESSIVGPSIQWRGTERGVAQATGPVAVPGRTGCINVDEIAYIQGKEVRQSATVCRDPNRGYVRV